MGCNTLAKYDRMPHKYTAVECIISCLQTSETKCAACKMPCMQQLSIRVILWDFYEVRLERSQNITIPLHETRAKVASDYLRCMKCIGSWKCLFSSDHLVMSSTFALSEFFFAHVFNINLRRQNFLQTKQISFFMFFFKLQNNFIKTIGLGNKKKHQKTDWSSGRRLTSPR